MPRVAFVTYQQSPGISDDDRLVAEVLHRRGVTVQAAIWDSPEVDWSSFDRVIIRSTWDYHLKPPSYERWVRSFLARPDQLWNPPALVLANLNKRYLIELAERGVQIVPTKYVAVGETQSLQAIIESQRWDDVVIKPAISATARGTWRSSLAVANADQQRFTDQAKAEDMLVQAYFPEIASSGEWSIIFFCGQYSHAVLKRPAHGDFRVQRHVGGEAAGAVPSPELVEQVSAILSKIGAPLLYARVDGIERDGLFVLMELESMSHACFSRFQTAQQIALPIRSCVSCPKAGLPENNSCPSFTAPTGVVI